MELIDRKTQSLRAEVSTANPNIKSLQLALQGSLLLRIFTCFLKVIITRGQRWTDGNLSGFPW